VPEQHPRRLADRLPVLLAAIGVGAILIATGVAVRSGQDQRVEVAAGATLTAQVPPTVTLTPTLTPTPTDTPTPTPTGTLRPTATFTPSLTPTATGTPLPSPVPTQKFSLDTGSYATPVATPATDVLPPADLIDVPPDVFNVLLLGSDKRPDTGGFLTDTVIVVTINVTEGTVNMISLPRDMEVYVPGWTLTKINRVFAHGQETGWPGGGFALMQQTLAYNFGIQVGHYALVDLTGFQGIVDALGGVEVPVDCSLQGYVLKPPRLKREDFSSEADWINYTGNDANWELYTLPVGVHKLDGYMALW
jgi:LCP family protein required for cell wall assembly